MSPRPRFSLLHALVPRSHLFTPLEETRIAIQRSRPRSQPVSLVLLTFDARKATHRARRAAHIKLTITSEGSRHGDTCSGVTEQNDVSHAVKLVQLAQKQSQHLLCSVVYLIRCFAFLCHVQHGIVRLDRDSREERFELGRWEGPRMETSSDGQVPFCETEFDQDGQVESVCGGRCCLQAAVQRSESSSPGIVGG